MSISSSVFRICCLNPVSQDMWTGDGSKESLRLRTFDSTMEGNDHDDHDACHFLAHGNI